MTTTQLKSIPLSAQMMDANQISSFTEETYEDKDYTAFEVYPTDHLIAAGTYLSADELLGSTISNDAILSAETLKVDISAQMTQVFELYSSVKKEDQDIIIHWGEYDSNGNEECTNLKLDAINSEFKKYDADGNPDLDGHNSIIGYEQDSDGYTYTIGVCHTYKEPGRKIVKITGYNYNTIRGYIATLFTEEHPAWQYAWGKKYNLISNAFSKTLSISKNVKNISSLFYNAMRAVSIGAVHNQRSAITNYSHLFKGAKNLLKFMCNSNDFFMSTIYTANALFSTAQNVKYTNLCMPINGTATPFIKSFYNSLKELSVDIASLIPQTGFSAKIIDVTDLFKNCKNLYGTVPAKLLWKDTSIEFINTENAFVGCSNEIRNQVPTSWGGTNTDIERIDKITDAIALHTMDGKVIETVDMTMPRQYSKWTINIPSDQYTMSFEDLKLEGRSYAYVDFGDGSSKFIVNGQTAFSHAYATAGTYTIKLEDILINARTADINTSCLVDVDFTDTHNFKFVENQFKYSGTNLQCIHGNMSELASSKPKQLFAYSTFKNFNFLSDMTDITAIYQSQFYQCSCVEDISYLTAFPEIQQIYRSGMYLNSKDTKPDFSCISCLTSLTTIDYRAFAYTYAPQYALPKLINAIDKQSFYQANGSRKLSVSFVGKTEEEIKSLENYPFAIANGSTISCLDDTGNPVTSFIVQS